VLRTRSTSVTKDELFTLEDSLAQAVFVSMMNSRYVSVKQGVYQTRSFCLSLILFFHVLSLEIPSFLPEKTQMFRLFSKKWESRGVVQRFPLKFKIPDIFSPLFFSPLNKVSRNPDAVASHGGG
jgi:hypothetical protein